MPPGTVRRWKSTQGWDSERSGKKANVRKQETEQNSKKVEAIAPEVQEVISNPDLTDKQRLFCLQYVRCFNATKAYQKAYRSSYMVANAEGYKLLVNPRVKAEIQRLKAEPPKPGDAQHRGYLSEVYRYCLCGCYGLHGLW